MYAYKICQALSTSIRRAELPNCAEKLCAPDAGRESLTEQKDRERQQLDPKRGLKGLLARLCFGSPRVVDGLADSTEKNNNCEAFRIEGSELSS